MDSENPETGVPQLDPWGLGQVEELLRGLEGVQSIKVVPDGDGGVDEVHVVGRNELSPKQVVRNIESALLAEFGLQIDHRKISVARIREPDISPKKVDSPGEPAPSAARSDRWLLLESLEIERRAGQKVGARIVLAGEGETFEGSAEGADFSRSRLEVAGAAVVDAVNQATVDDVLLRLEGVERVQALRRDFVLVLIQGQERRRKVSLPGISLVDDSPEEAAVLACLQATNRWAGAP